MLIIFAMISFELAQPRGFQACSKKHNTYILCARYWFETLLIIPRRGKAILKLGMFSNFSGDSLNFCSQNLQYLPQLPIGNWHTSFNCVITLSLLTGHQVDLYPGHLVALSPLFNGIIWLVSLLEKKNENNEGSHSKKNHIYYMADCQ